MRSFGTVGAVHPGDRPLLPDGLHRPAAVVAALAATVVVVLAVRYSGDSSAGRVDGRLDDAVDALPSGGYGLARAVTAVGSPVVVVVAAAGVALACLLTRRFRAAALTVAGPGLTGWSPRSASRSSTGPSATVASPSPAATPVARRR